MHVTLLHPLGTNITGVDTTQPGPLISTWIEFWNAISGMLLIHSNYCKSLAAMTVCKQLDSTGLKWYIPWKGKQLTGFTSLLNWFHIYLCLCQSQNSNTFAASCWVNIAGIIKHNIRLCFDKEKNWVPGGDGVEWYTSNNSCSHLMRSYSTNSTTLIHCLSFGCWQLYNILDWLVTQIKPREIFWSYHNVKTDNLWLQSTW